MITKIYGARYEWSLANTISEISEAWTPKKACMDAFIAFSEMVLARLRGLQKCEEPKN